MANITDVKETLNYIRIQIERQIEEVEKLEGEIYDVQYTSIDEVESTIKYLCTFVCEIQSSLENAVNDIEFYEKDLNKEAD